MRIWLSCLLMVAALAFAMTCAPGLEPTAPGVACVLACTGLLLSLGRAGKVPRWCVAMVMLATGYAAWRMATSPVADLARSDATLLVCGVCGFLWATQVGRSKAFQVFVAAVLLIALANVAVGVWQWKVDPKFLPLFANRQSGVFPCGFYGHYNHFANYLLASAMLAAGMAMSPSRSKFMRWVLAGVALLCGFGVGISQSRGAYLALTIGIGALLVAWLFDLRRRNVKWMPAVAFGVFLGVPVLVGLAWKLAPALLSQRVQEQHGVYDSLLSDGGRLEFASMAISVLQEQPLFGVGSRAFGYEAFRFWDPQALWVHSGDPEFAHNEWLQTAADYGLLGLVLLIGVWLVLLVRGVMVLALEPSGKVPDMPDTGITMGAMAALIAMLVQSMFSFVFHVAADVIVCGVLLGGIAAQPWPFAGKTLDGGRLSVIGYQFFAAILASVGIWLTWRDAPAWFVNARPDQVRMSRGAEERLRAAQRALKWREDFRLHKQASKAALDAARQSPDMSSQFLETAAAHSRKAVARHPMDYAARLMLANLLDEQGLVEEADGHFRALLPLLDVRELYYRARNAYGLHCARLGEMYWRKRQPELALAWFLECVRQMDLSAKVGGHGPDPKFMERVRKQIEFLQGARVQPDTSIVPVPDPEM